jgi:hypothetical protein
MATYTNEKLGVSFSLPDKLTIRQQLDWRGRVFESAGTTFLRHWLAVLPLIEDWDYEPHPKLEDIDLDKITDKAMADVIFWASNEAAGHMAGLDDIPKNE